MKSPIVVAGMHRSGTSLAASMVSALGMNMGENVLAADRNNSRGYFEDVEFLDLNRRMLQEATRPDDSGHPDWGWTESEQLHRERFEDFLEPARALVAGRESAGGVWGWKDPRTTLLLDFWDPLLADPVYLLVYRFPWEVADSMQRLGAEVFLRHPDYAWRIWAFYNRSLLDFHRRHRGRSILVSTDALQSQPGRLPELLRDRLGLEVSGAAEDLLEAEIFHALAADDPLIPLTLAAHPDCAALLRELEAHADLPAAGLWDDRPPAALPAPAGGGRLSVVIPCFDQGEFLIEAVASVERAVPEPCELIIVNDGSREPRTLEILEILRRAGYRIVDQENAGLAAARNRGFELALAPCVLPLDADNRLRPGFTGPAIQVLDSQPEVGVVYGDRRDFGLRSEVVKVPDFELDEILPFNFIDACALLRKEVWEACGGYDPAMPAPGWEDWDLWIGAAEKGWRFHHLSHAAFDYRVRPESMLSRFNDEDLRRRMMEYVIAKHRDLYWRRLPCLLVAAQRSAAQLHALSRDRDRPMDAGERGELLAYIESLRAKIAADMVTYQVERETRLRGEEAIAGLVAEVEVLRSKITADMATYQVEREARLRLEERVIDLAAEIETLREANRDARQRGEKRSPR